MIDVGRANLDGMNVRFKNLVDITFWSSGFQGSLSSDSFRGLENIHNFKVIDTKLSSISSNAFDNLRNLKGKKHKLEGSYSE